MNVDKITIYNNGTYLEIYPKEKKVLVDDKTLPIETETVKELIRIIRGWKSEYSDNSFLDGPRFEVKVYSEDDVITFRGVRGVPENYYDFTELVRRINGK